MINSNDNTYDPITEMFNLLNEFNSEQASEYKNAKLRAMKREVPCVYHSEGFTRHE